MDSPGLLLNMDHFFKKYFLGLKEMLFSKKLYLIPQTISDKIVRLPPPDFFFNVGCRLVLKCVTPCRLFWDFRILQEKRPITHHCIDCSNIWVVFSDSIHFFLSRLIFLREKITLVICDRCWCVLLWMKALKVIFREAFMILYHFQCTTISSLPDVLLKPLPHIFSEISAYLYYFNG